MALPRTPGARHIDKVSVEIEGGWVERPDHMRHDGSVHTSAPANGEVSPHGGLRVKEIAAWMVANYPDAVNSSCGMHVHLSFRRLDDYARLLDETFLAYTRDELRAWAGLRKLDYPVFFDRLDGRNNYCLNVWKPEEQLYDTNKSGTRYAIWNFCHALHGTAECRVLPMFPKMIDGISAVFKLIAIVEGWLTKAPKIRLGSSEKVCLEDDDPIFQDTVILNYTAAIDENFVYATKEEV